MRDPEALFASLQLDASLALAAPWESEPRVAARPLLTLASCPAFGAHRAWTVFDASPASLAVREVAWDRVSDLAAFAEPFPGRRRARPRKPTLALRDAAVPRAAFVDLLAAAEALLLPGEAPFSPAAGQLFSICFHFRPGSPFFKWGHDLPDGWERLAQWYGEAREALERAVLESAMPSR